MPVSRFTAASYETGFIFRVIHSMIFNIILYDIGSAENCRKTNLIIRVTVFYKCKAATAMFTLK